MSNCVSLKITSLGRDEIWSVDSGESLKSLPPKCQILSLKCTKIDLGWGSAPDLAGGAYSAPPTLSWIWGPLHGRGRGWAGKEEGKRKGKGRDGEVEGGKGRPPKLLLYQGPSEPCYATVTAAFRLSKCE